VALVVSLLALLGSLGVDDVTAAELRVGSGSTGIAGLQLASEPASLRMSAAGDLAAKTEVDTVYALGGPGTFEGRFETASGLPHWHGWTSKDYTRGEGGLWHIDTYHAENLNGHGPGNHAMWCGDMIPTCGPDDEEGGYGNLWAEYLDFETTAPDPLLATDMRITAVANIDTETLYDYVRFLVDTDTGPIEIASWDGEFIHEAIDLAFSVDPVDYVGPDSDTIRLRWGFTSDGGWSDEDCSYPTVGAIQLDDVTVYVEDEVVSFDDFENPDDVDWTVGEAPYVGDFAQIMSDLEDLDPCVSNRSPQVVFIDDGIVVPGTGGSPCITWCYGPDGWVVTPDGGLAGEDYQIQNAVISPVIEWPAGGMAGAILRFDAYKHEPAVLPSSQVFIVWGVRSINTGDPDDLEHAPWRSDNFLYLGGPEYDRYEFNVTDVLEQGPTHVQIQLMVWQIAVCGSIGPDGHPAPYYDNVSLAVYDHRGPSFNARDLELAQDTFPEAGSIDPLDLGSAWCRFDMARNISFDGETIDPGDSVVCRITPVRAGSVLHGTPRLFYTMKNNPVFDPYRSGFPTSGSVEGTQYVISTYYSFDLPDTGWFFPGDIIHYYIEARDDVAGDIGTAIFPADTTGFGDFTDELSYNSLFTVRALPTLRSAIPGDQPRILFWNDFGNGGGENEWTKALQAKGYWSGEQYDLYFTNKPEWGSGQGLGGRATPELLAGYDVMLYSSGEAAHTTLGFGGDWADVSRDVQVLDSWLRQGGKNAYFTGDGLASDLAESDPLTEAFLADWLGVEVHSGDVTPMIENQVAPTVRAVDGNPVFDPDLYWLAFGGCPRSNEFDAVTPLVDTHMLAEFLDTQGAGGQYPYAAASYNYVADHDARIVFQPHDLMTVYTPPEQHQGPLPTRAQVLEQVLLFFGHPGTGATVVPQAGTAAFTTNAYPNPFNPQVQIVYAMPRRGELSIRIYDLRGKLVSTLLDEEVDAGAGHVSWDGTDNSGRAVATGVYFCKTQTLDEVQVRKLTMIK